MSRGFRCKQFTVEQNNCAMKVNTDSMILGSWADPGNSRHILDIGTGTGILALMMAQKSAPTAIITAVEIDPAAYHQAGKNFAASPWASRMKVRLGDIGQLALPQKSDFIISNPPYFESVNTDSGAYASLSALRATARLENSLLPHTLMHLVKRQLTDYGAFYCVYPAARGKSIAVAAYQAGLGLQKRLLVHSDASREPYLVALKITHLQLCTKNAIPVEKLVIRESSGNYTSDFRHLCREFYLKF